MSHDMMIQSTSASLIAEVAQVLDASQIGHGAGLCMQNVK